MGTAVIRELPPGNAIGEYLLFCQYHFIPARHTSPPSDPYGIRTRALRLDRAVL